VQDPENAAAAASSPTTESKVKTKKINKSRWEHVEILQLLDSREHNSSRELAPRNLAFS
jgi:hypothetical protein